MLLTMCCAKADAGEAAWAMDGGVAISEPKLNPLRYQILGVLPREPRSGDDIVKQLESIRPVKTSQVYPTLARLEKQGFVVLCEGVQEGKHNKRVYSTTDGGKVILIDWIGQEPDQPVLHDVLHYDFLTVKNSGWTKEPAYIIDHIRGPACLCASDHAAHGATDCRSCDY